MAFVVSHAHKGTIPIMVCVYSVCRDVYSVIIVTLVLIVKMVLISSKKNVLLIAPLAMSNKYELLQIGLRGNVCLVIASAQNALNCLPNAHNATSLIF